LGAAAAVGARGRGFWEARLFEKGPWGWPCRKRFLQNKYTPPKAKKAFNAQNNYCDFVLAYFIKE